MSDYTAGKAFPRKGRKEGKEDGKQLKAQADTVCIRPGGGEST
jgi:hypothetical protein